MHLIDDVDINGVKIIYKLKIVFVLFVICISPATNLTYLEILIEILDSLENLLKSETLKGIYTPP